MRFSPKDVKMTWLGIGKTAPLEFRTEKKIFEKNIGGGLRKPPLGSTGLTIASSEGGQSAMPPPLWSAN